MTPETERQRMKRLYAEMNALWPADMASPTGQEAVEGVKRLLREGFRRAGKPCPTGFRFEVTSGNRHTWPRGKVWKVNPGKTGRFGGWRHIVHNVSHWVHARVSPGKRAHESHLPTERALIEYALANGFHTGALARQPKAATPKPSAKEVRARRVEEGIARWSAKLKRAQNALRKLNAQKRYYDRTLNPPL